MVLGTIFFVWHAKSNKAEKEYIQAEEGQAKVENAEKLLKIAQANRVNPYVNITPFVLDYGFPFVHYNGFFCSDGEVVVYACPANLFKDKVQVVGYRGRSTGTSVRVAKGLYIRSGRSGSNAVRAEVRKHVYSILHGVSPLFSDFAFSVRSLFPSEKGFLIGNQAPRGKLAKPPHLPRDASGQAFVGLPGRPLFFRALGITGDGKIPRQKGLRQ